MLIIFSYLLFLELVNYIQFLSMTTNETTFEEFISQYIIDNNGYVKGEPKDFDKDCAIDTKQLWKFLMDTQASTLSNYYGSSVSVVDRITKKIKEKGIIDVLRNPVEVNNINLRLFYPKPSKSDSQSAWDCYNKNVFAITRQVTYSKLHPGNEIDLVVFVNGLPIITIELKYSHTGQSAFVDAIKQYKTDRDPKDLLLNFGRCLAHFAVDDNEIYFTTRLNGDKTYFMPFNKGLDDGQGAGNPPNYSGGYKTHYLWEHILTKDVLSDIINNYVLFDYGDKDKEKKVSHNMKNAKKLIFPRYHQLDVVNKLLGDVSACGVGKTYLIQHSAGSGKSNSITWLAYKILGVCPDTLQANKSKSLTQNVFDSAIVVTDRRLLDKQIKNNILAFQKSKDFVAHADNSDDLKKAIENDKKIIITTIQKFPFICDTISDVSNKNFAIIIDEAHSSQTGIASDKLNASLEKAKLEDGDIDAVLLKVARDSKLSSNCSYFAFTATPKVETLERFGTKNSNGGFDPFHLYSMKQAIEEGFILDVLTNYLEYHSFYEITKTVTDNPAYNNGKAQKKIKSYVEREPKTIEVKARIMLEHFVKNVYKTQKLNGHAKSMVVTKDIECAITYYFALQEALKEYHNPFKIAIAFSGEKEYNNQNLTESSLNGFSSDLTATNFDDDEYKILVVANKYLTGFDQPKLTAMYIDKKLEDVLAVQTLSRLNRTCPEYGKTSNDLFVLDFYNTKEDMENSFQPYYTSLTLDKATDVNVLHDIRSAVLGYAFFDEDEIQDFVVKLFKEFDSNTWITILDKIAYRFNVEEDFSDVTKADIKAKCKQFFKIYSRMRAIIPYVVLDWEKFFWLVRYLIPKLIVKGGTDDDVSDLLKNIDLNTYGLSKKALEPIVLDSVKTELDPKSNNVVQVTPGKEDKDPLDLIIELFNKRWFDKWKSTPDEQRVKLLRFRDLIWNHPNFAKYIEDNPDKEEANKIFIKIIQEIIRNTRTSDMSFYKEFFGDKNFQKDVTETLINISKVEEYRKRKKEKPFDDVAQDSAIRMAAEP